MLGMSAHERRLSSTMGPSQLHQAQESQAADPLLVYSQCTGSPHKGPGTLKALLPH